MSFKFNFSQENEEEHIDADRSEGEINDLTVKECEEIYPNDQFSQLSHIAEHAKMFVYKEVELAHVIPGEVLAKLQGIAENIKFAEHQHSDLIPGTYEGGLKIWECTNDLLKYLIDNDRDIEFNNGSVLDLGCGAGLLGIYALLQGANVTFQDYNKDVLEIITIPNVLLNIEERENKTSDLKKCKFYSGDWSSFNQNLAGNIKYDIILTSETIYSTNNYNKLIKIFMERLNKGGLIYVAAKTHYFGVGGGLRQFENCIDKQIFKIRTCWNSLGGVQREILEIKTNL